MFFFVCLFVTDTRLVYSILFMWMQVFFLMEKHIAIVFFEASIRLSSAVGASFAPSVGKISCAA